MLSLTVNMFIHATKLVNREIYHFSLINEIQSQEHVAHMYTCKFIILRLIHKI